MRIENQLLKGIRGLHLFFARFVAVPLTRARALLKEEMIEMMATTFDEMKLQPGFTFRVVEALKRTKIQAPPSKMTLPFGVSIAAGLIVLLLSLSIPYSPLYPIGQLVGSVLPSQMSVVDEDDQSVLVRFI